MQRFTSTDLKNRLGDVAEEARIAPVVVARNGRPDLVVMSFREYLRLQKESDAAWGAVAKKVHSERDYLSAEETRNVLDEILKEEHVRKGRDKRRPPSRKPATTQNSARRRKIAIAAQ
jgi:prevent-host-death family protein